MKSVKDSSITVVQQMTNADANLAGNVHGGTIMKLIDNTASMVAARHTQSNVVTASIDRLDFHNPVFIGDLLRIMASINFVGKTSMEIGVRVESENVFSGEVRHTASAYLTFVALGNDLKPIDIAPVRFETEEQLRRYREASERRQYRLRWREQRGAS
ncbi:MAG: acyl-CoA thioesterase [Deltaproteobacteria bacterium]|nr:acyl-CoA thioesterase [Deltaproteobacteria bacterium]